MYAHFMMYEHGGCDISESGKINPWLLLGKIEFVTVVEKYGSSTSAGDDGSDYAGDLSLIYECSVGERLCLRINMWGIVWKVSFHCWSNGLCLGLSFCIQKINSAWEIKFMTRLRLRHSAGDSYVLFQGDWHQCLWVLLLCGECMYQ